MSYRIPRVNSEMQRCVSEIIRYKVKDPKVSSMVSVLDVSVSKDLRSARVRVSIFGENKQETFDALVRSAGFIRREAAVSLKNYRSIPDFTFVLDGSAEYGAHIDKLLGQLNLSDESDESENDDNSDSDNN